MLKLKGETLGKRQQDLNQEVLKTTSKNVDFRLIEPLEEQTDIDRLYKIDVASVYKDFDYIIETLKCGDSLYISRALKCTWLYENDRDYKINPDFLHHKVFPFMSTKMKKKFLTTISMYVRDENRAQDFYKYCLTDIKLKNIAMKFLIWTSEQYKMEYLCSNGANIEALKLKHFIGQSFNLAEAYLIKEENQNRCTNKVHELRYLSKISDENYLDLMEKYTTISGRFYGSQISRFGLRFSKEIMTKHKERVFNNVHLYFKILNIGIIVKYSSVEDVKRYAVGLLPPTASEFWYMDFYTSYQKILNLLPQNNLYLFLREIFLTNYPGELFEMSKRFYDLKYYRFLSPEEREAWALKHLRESIELLGPELDYLWYNFVNYNLAFKEIKKFISATTNRSKRSAMINVLIECAKNEEQLESLISYYYARHVNERKEFKLIFIDKVIEKNNVFKFDEKCWDNLYKLLHSSNVLLPGYSWSHNKYKTLVILYHIIHDKEIPDVLDNYIMTSDNAHNVPFLEKLHEKLTDDQVKLIYKSFIDMSTSKLEYYNTQSYDTIKDNATYIIDFVLAIMNRFKKTKDDCPEIIVKFVKLDWDRYKYHHYFVVDQDFVEKKLYNTEAKLLQLLKQDYKLLLDILPNLSAELSRMKIKNLLKKIRIYFSHDFAKDWLCCCEKWLSENTGYEISLFKAIIVSIFLIGSDDYKIAFIAKYVPVEPKISHDKIERKLLTIQEGICRFAHYSRPPVPLETILPYIIGDYVRFCLPMFSSYLANLPMPQCLKFISTILNTPVSIQKHGIRSAFQSFNVEHLANLVVNVWKSTNNVSLRMTIYKALFTKIAYVDEDAQFKLYEILKTFTLDLEEDDDGSVFSLLTCFDVPKYKGDFLKTAWTAVQNLSERPKNIKRKYEIVCKIDREFLIMDKEFCRANILDEFIHSMLIDKNILQISQNYDEVRLIDAKWRLTVKYIIYIDKDQIERSLEFVHLILHKCIEMWDVTDIGIYKFRKFMFEFINKNLDCFRETSDKIGAIPILKYILKLVSELLPITHIYELYMELNLIIISIKVMEFNKCKYANLTEENVANSLSAEVIAFLDELNTKKLLYSTFYNEITSLLCNVIQSYVVWNTCLDSSYIETLLSSNFIEAELPAIRLFAVMLLPKQRPENHVDTWLNVIQKVRGCNNDAFSAYLSEHFIYRNFEQI